MYIPVMGPGLRYESGPTVHETLVVHGSGVPGPSAVDGIARAYHPTTFSRYAWISETELPAHV